jgi:hypothetical protein
MNYVFIDHSTRMYIIKYEKIHAELVTSTYIAKYLKLLNHYMIWGHTKLEIEWEFGGRSLEIFCLFHRGQSFGGNGNGSLDGQPQLIIKSLGMGENYVLI